MNMAELRNYIISHLSDFDVTFTAKDTTTNNTYTAVYLIEKPECHKLTSGNALIIKWNELDGGNYVRHFKVEITILADKLKNAISIKDTLIDMLDFYKEPCKIPEYTKFRFSNEGGIWLNKDTLLYNDKLFFECKII